MFIEEFGLCLIILSIIVFIILCNNKEYMEPTRLTTQGCKPPYVPPQHFHWDFF